MSVVRRLIQTVLLLSLAFGVGCNHTGSSDSSLGRKYGDASATLGIVLTYANARLRCGTLDHADNKYKVLCQAVAIDSAGNEAVATLAPDLKLQWGAPKLLGGSPMKDIYCRNDALSQTCDITMPNASAATLGFYLTVSNSVQEKTEIDTVQLKYSVSTLGLVPQIPISFAKIPDSPTLGQAAGFQSDELDLNKARLSDFSSVCATGEKIYFTASNYIYSLDNGKVKLFAGSTIRENANNFSHRLRIHFHPPAYLSLACSDDAVFVLESNRNRVLRLPQEGPIQVVTADKISDPYAFALGTDSSVHVVTGKSIVRVDFSGKTAAVFDGATGSQDFGPLESVAVTQDGSVFFSDPSNNRIYRLRNGVAILVAGQFNYPSVLRASTDNSLLVFDSGNNRIQRIGSSGKVTTVTTVASSGYDTPLSMFQMSNGSLLFTESVHDRIQKLDPSGSVATVIAKTAGPSADGELVDKFQFSKVSGLAQGIDGSIYLAEPLKNRILKIDSQRKVRIVAGTDLNNPTDVVVAPNGSVYIADTNNNRIRMVEPNGRITTVLENLSSPSGLAYASDDLYVADTGNNRILKQSSSGAVSTFIADIRAPMAIAVDSEGSVFASDYYGLIRKVDAAGIVSTTIAGGGSNSLFELSEGPARRFNLQGLQRLSAGENGKVYVVDDYDKGMSVLNPQRDGSYRLERFFNGDSQKDCGTGIIEKTVARSDMVKSLQVTMGSICQGHPRSVSGSDRCAEPSGRFTLLLAQELGAGVSNIIQLSFPCRP